MKKTLRCICVIALFLTLTVAILAIIWCNVPAWKLFISMYKRGFILGQYRGLGFLKELIIPTAETLLLLSSCVFWIIALVRGKTLHTIFFGLYESTEDVKERYAKAKETRRKKQIERAKEKSEKLKSKIEKMESDE